MAHAQATPQHIGVENTSPNASTAPDELNSGGQNDPREQARVTSIPNMLPPFIYTHMIFMSAFSWDSSQKPNTIIWQTPLHPYYMNWAIKHLAEMFNIWAGSFNFEFVIAGTGFNGGKLAAVWIPPNLNPDDMDLAGKTTFSFGMIDPKDTGPTVINGRDQRIQKAHWMMPPGTTEFKVDDLSKYAEIGGTLALVVINPLVSSSLEKTSVNISVFNSCGPDFSMNQFKPISKAAAKSKIPDIYFDESICPFLPDVPMDTLHVDPLGLTTSADIAALVDIGTGEYSRLPKGRRFFDLRVWSGNDFGHDDGVGDFYAYWPFYASQSDQPEKTVAHRVKINRKNNWILYGNTDEGSQWYWAADYTEFGVNNHATSGQPDSVYFTQSFENSNGFKPSYPQFSLEYPINEAKRPNFMTVTRGTIPVQPWEKIESDIGENVVLFGYASDDPGAGYPVTKALMDYFKTMPFPGVQDPVFNVVDIDSKLPLLTIRLNRDGFFTAAPTKKRINFDLKEIFLQYQFSIDHHAKLPQSPAQNLAVYRAKTSQYELAAARNRISQLSAILVDQNNKLEHLRTAFEELKNE